MEQHEQNDGENSIPVALYFFLGVIVFSVFGMLYKAIF